MTIKLFLDVCSHKQYCRTDLYPCFLGYIFKYFFRTVSKKWNCYIEGDLCFFILMGPVKSPPISSVQRLSPQQLSHRPSPEMGGFFASLLFCLFLLQSSRLSYKPWPKAIFLSLAAQLCQRPHFQDSVLSQNIKQLNQGVMTLILEWFFVP